MNNNSSHYRSRTKSRRSPRWVPWLALLIVTTGACSSGAAPDPGRMTVVTTTSILGDVAANVVGDAGTVTVLLPRSADPHDYQASSRQVADIIAADLVIANGLHLEEGLDDVLTTAESDGARILWIGDLIDPIPFGDSRSEGHSDFDPHFWFDPLRVAEAASAIAGELEEMAPGGGWSDRAAAYAAELREADADIIAILAAVPPERRSLVTSHDAFGYFALRYGFEVLGTVIPGGSTMAEPSAAELSELVGIIEAAAVPAIFTDAAESARLADSLARELGGAVEVVRLHTGALGEEGSSAGTLIGMLTTNAILIAEALS